MAYRNLSSEEGEWGFGFIRTEGLRTTVGGERDAIDMDIRRVGECISPFLLGDGYRPTALISGCVPVLFGS